MVQMDVETMETLANPSKGGGTSSGHSGKGGHGIGIVGIPRNPKTLYVTRTYTKNWIFFSYGFKNTRLTINDVDYWCTPLSLIPVDLLPLYVDPAEYKSNPVNSFHHFAIYIYYIQYYLNKLLYILPKKRCSRMQRPEKAHFACEHNG